MIVVMEDNGRFGPDRSVTVPCKPTFPRLAGSPPGIHYGAASLAVTVGLGVARGYDYVGSNSADTNTLFAHADMRPTYLPRLTSAQGFRPLRIREERGADGRLIFATPADEEAALAGLPLVEALRVPTPFQLRKVRSSRALGAPRSKVGSDTINCCINGLVAP